jgi:uncharacterized protein YaaW (UPF0174 family)
MGGNTFANLWREHGVRYGEIVTDVAKRVGADLTGCWDIGEREWRIVERVIEQAEEKMNAEEREEFYQELRKQSGVHSRASLKDLLRNQAVYQAVRLIIIRVIVRQMLVKLGIQSAAKLAGGRLVTILAGPIGAVVGGIWTVIDLAGPAWSVTVPGVLVVAMIRARLEAEKAAAEIGEESNERVRC